MEFIYRSTTLTLLRVHERTEPNAPHRTERLLGNKGVCKLVCPLNYQGAGPFGFRPAPSGHKQVLRHARLLRYGSTTVEPWHLGGRGLDALLIGGPRVCSGLFLFCCLSERLGQGAVQGAKVLSKVPARSPRPPGRRDHFRGFFPPKKIRNR